jgi:sulfur transfer protein SufE
MTDKNDNNNHSPDAVEHAMNTVLEAERAAEQAIADCNSEAQLAIQAAQEQAQHIATRTDARLTLCHRRCNARVSREIRARELAEQADLQDRPGQELDDVALAAVIETVARELLASPRSAGDDSGTSE